MARKKRGRTSRNSRKVVKRRASIRNKRRFGISNLNCKINIVLNNLLLFIALSLVSFVLYRFIQNNFLNDLFFIIAIVFGFIGVGFLIVLLVLFIMKLLAKKR